MNTFHEKSRSILGLLPLSFVLATDETFLQLMESTTSDTLLEATDILLKQNVNFGLTNKNGMNVAHVVGDNITIDGSLYHKWVTIMVNNGFKCVWKHLDFKQKSPFHIALTSKRINYQTLEIIFDESSDDVNHADIDGFTILSLAIKFQSPILVNKIIDLGGDVKTVDKLGWNLLHFAVYRGHLEIVELILGLGVSPNAKNIHGRTPVHCISLYDDTMAQIAIEITHLLLMYGANLLTQCLKGFSVLLYPWKSHTVREDWKKHFLGE